MSRPGLTPSMWWWAVLLASCHAAPPAPPRFQSPPLPPDVVAELEARASEEVVRWRRERDERLLDMVDPGELAEHAARIRQSDIDDKKARLDDIFRQGEAIFERRFTRREGLGTGRLQRPAPALSRVENAAILGGPDALSCRECHGRGGDDGHGELHQRALLDGDGRHVSSAHPRVAPHLAGLGLVQALAEEMTSELSVEVESHRALARQTGAVETLELRSKGVSFGEVAVSPDGSLDTSRVRGVDADRVVRPFGWKGTSPSLVDFVRQALPQHLGLELPVPSPPRPNPDEDHDGIPSELSEGQISSLATYLALLDVPVVLPPEAPETARAFVRGMESFRTVGCATCHRPELPLRSSTLRESAPGGGGDHPGLALDLVRDGQVPPRPEQFDYASLLAVRLFSDLKRHDLGPALAERGDHGVAPSVFLTRPLWGLGDRGNNYLHDGRARSLSQAILLHGGEAQSTTDAYRMLSTEDQREIEVFILSLRRAPQGRILP